LTTSVLTSYPQNWYTQMVGSPLAPAELIGAADFVGIAIIDADRGCFHSNSISLI